MSSWSKSPLFGSAVTRPLTITFVVGARPNFPKVAPILAALRQHEDVQTLLVHTGQHYDPELSSMFFEDLGIADPDYLLGVGSGSHAKQTADVMVAFEQRCLEDKPDAIVVLGDVNSTVACALVGAKLLIPVVHVEAGLRSETARCPKRSTGSSRTPSQTVSTPTATKPTRNLAAEGIQADRIRMVGNVMIDTLLRIRPKAQRPLLNDVDFDQPYGLVTLHRPALVDSSEKLEPMLRHSPRQPTRCPSSTPCIRARGSDGEVRTRR